MKPKPCPFCGSTRILESADEYALWCPNCACVGPAVVVVRSGRFPNKQAVRAWNMRKRSDTIKEHP